MHDISGDEYLDIVGAKTHLIDAIAKISKTRPDDPLKHLSEYFASVVEGLHVEGREYSYISATAHNRICFLHKLRTALKSFAKDYEGDLCKAEFSQVVLLLCNDFPSSAVDRAFEPTAFDRSVDFRFLCFAASWIYSDLLMLTSKLYSTSSDVQADRLLAEIRSQARVERYIVPPIEIIEACVHPSLTFLQFCTAFISNDRLHKLISAQMKVVKYHG